MYLYIVSSSKIPDSKSWSNLKKKIHSNFKNAVVIEYSFFNVKSNTSVDFIGDVTKTDSVHIDS